MKSSDSYKITDVKLVEFHNLGTTTIEISECGQFYFLNASIYQAADADRRV